MEVGGETITASQSKHDNLNGASCCDGKTRGIEDDCKILTKYAEPRYSKETEAGKTRCIEEGCCSNGRNVRGRVNFGCWLAPLPSDATAGRLPSQLRRHACQLHQMSAEDINSVNTDC